MFRIGQKVKLKNANDLIGYIVRIEIDPLEENDVSYEVKYYVTYRVRRYAPFLINGYNDFGCTENDIEPI